MAKKTQRASFCWLTMLLLWSVCLHLFNLYGFKALSDQSLKQKTCAMRMKLPRTKMRIPTTAAWVGARKEKANPTREGTWKMNASR
jgi:hypothetical protein